MVRETKLPFKVGEMAEVRSFELGYRGAWFRCKIKQIKEKGFTYILEYNDYPDENPEKMKVYQAPPYRLEDRTKELMIRPPYPTLYNKGKMPSVSEISELAVVVDCDWKVGDIVDWWYKDCFWCGRIIELSGEGKGRIELHPPPIGEGDKYDFVVNDLRPSLDWSPEHSWTLRSEKGVSGRCNARLIKPTSQVMDKQNASQDIERRAGSSVKGSLLSPPSSSSKANSEEQKSTGTMEVDKQCSGNAVSKDLMKRDGQEKITRSSVKGSLLSPPSSSSIANSDAKKSTKKIEVDKRCSGNAVSKDLMKKDGQQKITHSSVKGSLVSPPSSIPVANLDGKKSTKTMEVDKQRLENAVSKDLMKKDSQEKITRSSVKGSLLSPPSSSPVAISDGKKSTKTVEVGKQCSENADLKDLMKKDSQEKITRSSVKGSLVSPHSSSSVANLDGKKSTKTVEVDKQSSENAVSKELMKKVSQDKITRSDCGNASKRNLNETNACAKDVLENLHWNRPVKKRGPGDGLFPNSIPPDPAEAAVLELEDYLDKVKHLKAILLHGISESDSPRPKWQYIHKHEPSQPK